MIRSKGPDAGCPCSPSPVMTSGSRPSSSRFWCARSALGGVDFDADDGSWSGAGGQQGGGVSGAGAEFEYVVTGLGCEVAADVLALLDAGEDPVRRDLYVDGDVDLAKATKCGAHIPGHTSTAGMGSGASWSW